MKLAKWLLENGVRRNAFARRIGVSGSLITLLCDGKTWPSHRVSQEIARETAGAVTANDFVKPPQGQSEDATAQREGKAIA